MAQTVKRKSSKVLTEHALIGSIVEKMDKKFGEGAALIPDAGTILCKVDHWVSTRNFLIDSAIAGGLPLPRPLIPFGRLTEISGKNGTGKTTLLGQIIAETQATGGLAVILDTEQALDLAYFAKLGVDLSKMIIVQAETIEEVFTRMETLIEVVRSQDADVKVCIGWDSLGGTPTKAQLGADADDHFYAEAAKVVGKNLQRTMQLINRQRIALIFNNHVYRNINIKYGDPMESYGGEKVQFFSTLRMRLKRIGQIKDGEDNVIGHKVQLKVLKNKMAPILRTVDVPCLGNLGFSLDYSVYEHAISQGLFKGKTWKEWVTAQGEVVKFQGWRGFQEKVLEHDDYPELVTEVVKMYHQRATTEE